MKVDKSNQCFFITPLLDTLSMKTFHQITGTTIALVILSAWVIELGKVHLVRKKGLERKACYSIGFYRFMVLVEVDLEREVER